jgi:hypothetical protein
MKATGVAQSKKMPAWVFAKIKKANEDGQVKPKPVSKVAKHVSEAKRKPQMFVGNPPSEADGWFPVGDCKTGNRENWTVYCRPQNPESEWVGVKVVANQASVHKANYWVSYNFVVHRAAKGKDFVLMQDNRPDLHKEFLGIMQRYPEGNSG